ncbi:MAG: response regulator transcription factor [Thermoleophilia bacterium]|nr:response regulator transcription factor [Thermoleophilia bacterium]
MSDAAVAVLVASGSPAYAAGLAGFLREPPLEPVVAHTTGQALALAAARPPLLAVVDERLADGPGLDLVGTIREAHPSARVLVATWDGSSAAQVEALAAGAVGVVLATWTREAVLEAVADALRGVVRFDVEVVRSLGALARQSVAQHGVLTDQERVVLRLMRQGLTYKEIALRLGVSWHTVRTHAQSILRKLGVHSRRELGGFGAAEGLALAVAG